MQASANSTNANPPEQSDSSDRHTFVVIAPKFDSPNDKPASSEVPVKAVEALAKEKITWKAVDVESTGRVGIFACSGALNDKRPRPLEPGPIKDHEEKSRTLLEFLNRYLYIEEARMRILNNKYTYNLIRFRAVAEGEMVKEDTTLVPYTKAATGDSNVLLYKMARSDHIIIRTILEANGFRYTDKHSWNILWTSGHTKPYLYEGLNEYQKINHFPGSFEITRKDRLCDNIVQKQQKYGKSVFDIIPDTYVLPDEFADFYTHFHELKKVSAPNIWILKPNASSRGRGIHLVTDANNVPVDEPCVISKYIHNPLLINSLKFDMRIYVVLTSLDPLRIYVYNEGLARFCTEKYDPNSKDNRFSHLTNYSVNKKNEKFVANKRADADNVGQKWSLTALNKYFEKHSVDVSQLWARIYDLIIKTIIACEPALYAAYKKTTVYRGNCFELFGFDVLLDENLKPWLMEVNLSPSLACESPLDHQIKSNLIADLFTLVGIRQFDRRKDGAFRGRPTQPQVVTNSKKRIIMKGRSVDRTGDEEFKASAMYKKLAQIPPKHREILIDTLEEYERKHNFIRIYPSKGTDHYDNLFEVTRINHKVLYRFLYGNDFTFKEKEILQCGGSILPSIPDTRAPTQVWHKEKPVMQDSLPRREPESPSRKSTKDSSKILITGDDILIEYVERLTLALKTIKDTTLKPNWSKSIEKFVNHEVWHCDSIIRGPGKTHLWQRLEEKLIEMKNRRKRMLKATSLAKTTAEFESIYNKEQERKQAIIQAFSVSQLEEMLRSSTRNIAYEVVTCLIPCSSPGVLFNIVTWLSTFKRTLISSEQYLILDQKSDKNAEEAGESVATLGGKTMPYNTSKTMQEGEARMKTKTQLTPIKHAADSDKIQNAKQMQPNIPHTPADFSKALQLNARLSKAPTGEELYYSHNKGKGKHRVYRPIGTKAALLAHEDEMVEEQSVTQSESNEGASGHLVDIVKNGE